jgi:hypothetical protein
MSYVLHHPIHVTYQALPTANELDKQMTGSEDPTDSKRISLLRSLGVGGFDLERADRWEPDESISSYGDDYVELLKPKHWTEMVHEHFNGGRVIGVEPE